MESRPVLFYGFKAQGSFVFGRFRLCRVKPGFPDLLSFVNGSSHFYKGSLSTDFLFSVHAPPRLGPKGHKIGNRPWQCSSVAWIVVEKCRP